MLSVRNIHDVILSYFYACPFLKTQKTLELILKYFPHLSQKQITQFAGLDHLYREWNTKINVISRKDMDALYEKHVLHSLFIAKVFELQKNASVIDIGTGGGFPGIPLAIYFPETHFRLIDSIGKKIKVVNAVKDALQLSNVTVMNIRAEQIKGSTYDLAISRAVAPLKKLIGWSKPLIKKPGKNDKKPSGLLCYKGGDLTGEIAESDSVPFIYNIRNYFKEDYFEEKYLLHVQW